MDFVYIFNFEFIGVLQLSADRSYKVGVQVEEVVLFIPDYVVSLVLVTREESEADLQIQKFLYNIDELLLYLVNAQQEETKADHVILIQVIYIHKAVPGIQELLFDFAQRYLAVDVDYNFQFIEIKKFVLAVLNQGLGCRWELVGLPVVLVYPKHFHPLYKIIFKGEQRIFLILKQVANSAPYNFDLVLNFQGLVV